MDFDDALEWVAQATADAPRPSAFPWTDAEWQWVKEFHAKSVRLITGARPVFEALDEAFKTSSEEFTVMGHLPLRYFAAAANAGRAVENKAAKAKSLTGAKKASGAARVQRTQAADTAAVRVQRWFDLAYRGQGHRNLVAATRTEIDRHIDQQTQKLATARIGGGRADVRILTADIRRAEADRLLITESRARTYLLPKR